MTQQRFRRRLAPAELLEHVHRMTAAAECQHGVAEPPTRRTDRFGVIEPGVLEGVGRQVVTNDFARYGIGIAMIALWSLYFLSGRNEPAEGGSPHD